jgi:uncharacterized membrane protein (UPF0127 family)
MFQRLAALFLLSASFVMPTHAQQPQPQTDLARTQLSVGLYKIDTQVAQTPQQREHRPDVPQEMPQAEGMLFVFEQPSTQCFWMKNTLLPLTAAFVADDGRIVNMVDMQPLTLDSHCSEEPVRYVLEMNQGWFAKKNIKKGAKLGGEPFQPDAETAGRDTETKKKPARGPAFSRAERSGLQPKFFCDEVPVHQLGQEGLDELRAQVAVVDVVGVFPDVHGQQRLVGGGQRRAGGAGVHDVHAAVGFFTSQVQPEPKLPTADFTKASLKAS